MTHEIIQHTDAIAPWLIPVIGGAAQAVGNIFGHSNTDQQQYDQQVKLQGLQLQGAKEMADVNKNNQMEIWNKTNYGAQMDKMKEAGINPALMYGQAGAGGTTGGSTTGAMPTGATASDSSSRDQQKISMGLMLAQTANLAANTAKTTEEAKKIAGADTANTEAQTGLTQQQTKYSEILTKYQNESIEYQLDKIAQEANIALGQAQSAGVKGNVDQATAVEQIQKVKQEAANTAIQAVAMKQGIQLEQAKVQEITNSIQQKWRELELKGQGQNLEHNDRVKAIEEFTANALKVAGIQAAGNVVGDVVKIATRQSRQRIETRDNNGNHEIKDIINKY